MNNKVKSLYIHIPFCQHICDYCDFTKILYFPYFVSPYLSSLENELKNCNINSNLETIYIGGGTPTSLNDDEFLRLLQIVDKYRFNIKEYTIETNPETLTLKKIKLMKKYGVNRVSIGVESTDDVILKSINRYHTFNDVIKAINLLKNNGIDNINIDLILGLPNVSKKMLKKDIDNVLSLDVKHISCYALSVHPHTVFYLNKIDENDQDYERELYDIIHTELIKHGFQHYEVSNFAKDGYESVHNLTYWKNEQYFGVGLGASSYIGNNRSVNTKNLNKYIARVYDKEIEKVELKDQIIYEIMLNLRTKYGLDIVKLKNDYNYYLLKIKKNIIDSYIKEGYLILNNNKLIATYNGMMILDNIVENLI